MDSMISPKKLFWIGGVILLFIVGRMGWLVQTGGLEFESDITALLPISENSWLVNEVDNKIAAEVNDRIAIIVKGQNLAQTDGATNRLANLLTQGMVQNKILASQIGELEFDLLPGRIEAMLQYKDRLIGDRSRRRMQDSIESQLRWRMDQVTKFPPLNITDPVADPLGTLEEFLAERLPSLHGVRFDGVFLRVDSDTPANLLLLELAKGEPGNQKASDSVRWIIDAKNMVAGEFDVNIYASGVPLHAVAIKDQTIKEVQWMAILSVILTIGIFLYVTRSVRALLVSTLLILLAVAGGLVISQGTVGLPHLIGLTMAVTAIGICIDFSLHFWIHVRAGMNGATAIRTIRSGINMSFLTTVIGLLVITFTAVPVLVRSAVFICGALLVSWLIVRFIVPQFAGGINATQPSQKPRGALSRKITAGLVLVVACISVVGLMLNYYTDDNPARLGRLVDNLVQDDREVRNFLGITDQPGIYLVQANSAKELLESEETLLNSLTENELSYVNAVRRLVVPEAQQRDNQLLFKRAMDNLDVASVQQYLSTLQVPALEWESKSKKQYTLQWVLAQPWASIERDNILVCGQDICASIIRAQGTAIKKLDTACQYAVECSRISLLERQLSAFKNLRHSLSWTLLLAAGAIFVVLYFRYRNKAFKLIAVPLLATVSGIAAVAWAGMPITVFTLAAVFPLLGLSLDYVIFASESSDHSASTFLAIFASALTTSLSFWILSFSGTAAVRFFALPVAVGILVAWISVQIMRSDHV